MEISNISAIVLAAGKGTRMESSLPKILHEIGGKPMIKYTLEKLESMGFKQIIIVIGYGADQVQDALGPNYTYAFQENPQGGTADAVRAGLEKLDLQSEIILIVNGDDSGFYKNQTLEEFLAFHTGCGNVISIITTSRPQTERLGRIIRDKNGEFKKTIEAWEYEKSRLKSDEINCGAYLFNTKWLKKNIKKIDNKNYKSEYRITETLNLAHKQGLKVGLFKLNDPSEWVGVNTKEDLQKANELTLRGSQ